MLFALELGVFACCKYAINYELDLEIKRGPSFFDELNKF